MQPEKGFSPASDRAGTLISDLRPPGLAQGPLHLADVILKVHDICNFTLTASSGFLYRCNSEMGERIHHDSLRMCSR